MEKLYTLKETAETAGFSEQHLRKLCHTKRVAHTRKGDRYYFTAEEAARLIVHVVPAVDPTLDPTLDQKE